MMMIMMMIMMMMMGLDDDKDSFEHGVVFESDDVTGLMTFMFWV